MNNEVFNPIDSPEVPWWMVVSLRNRFRISTFVETGTGYGNTSIVAAKLFEEVYTIEIDPAIFGHQKKELLKSRNVRRYCGDSSKLIKEVLKLLNSPAIFYLDAHFNGMGKKIAKVECPLLFELQVILSKAKKRSCILIDNAGMFLHPPHYPHAVKEWPTIKEIVDMVKPHSNYSIQLLCDTLIITPEPIFQVFEAA